MTYDMNTEAYDIFFMTSMAYDLWHIIHDFMTYDIWNKY